VPTLAPNRESVARVRFKLDAPRLSRPGAPTLFGRRFVVIIGDE
jgi:hypothetical protein